ncbi:elongation factor G [candidate division TA06 bacterium]|uniref:Elongation factor G n=1 Tax=candidate division TA06 bacterium TaxID=2250710 RepID=A0A523UTS4_UNCT6|nr:MAG: elongation factor G [candidate division TA06 bacterium]
MKDYNIEKIRNICLASHGGSGKTTLAEAMLYDAKATTRLGKVDAGNSIMDYDQDEIDRKCSINLSLAHFNWKDKFLNLIDTPGYADFMGERIAGMRVADSCIIVIDVASGLEVGTEMAWQEADKMNLPRILFVNKMTKENVNFREILEKIIERFGTSVLPLQIPIGSGSSFKGVVDLIEEKAITYENGKMTESEIPDDMKESFESFKEKMVESVAETEDSLTEKYLDKGLSREEVITGLKAGVTSGKLFPVLCGDAFSRAGVDRLLDGISKYLPSPKDRPPITGKDKSATRENSPDAPLSALVFKTLVEPHVGELNLVRVYSGVLSSGREVINSTKGSAEKISQIFLFKGKERIEVKEIKAGNIGALVKLKNTRTGDTLADKGNPIVLEGIDFPRPAASIAIVPRTKGDEDRVSSGLARIAEEDPTFSVKYDAELKQTLIYGLGELHLEVVVSRLRRKFGVDMELVKPRIPYRETVRRKVEVQGKYKKQSGGRGQYGDVWVRFEPLKRGSGFEFVNGVVGGSIPSKYIPSVEKGIRGAMQKGVIAGYPTVDLKATAYDGSYHSVDSSDIAFKIAGSLAFKKGQETADSYLLEPISAVEVVIPEEYMGDVMGDLNSRRGKIQGMESEGTLQKIKAAVPQAEMYRYSSQLRSMTQGRGTFSQTFSHYEEVPREIAERIISETAKEKEQEK